MFAQITSAAIRGIESYRVSVEVNLSRGLPSFSVVGLPQGAVRESRDRVWAALGHLGVHVPSKKITVNLAPADVKKGGSAFDLPIAVGLLACAKEVPPSRAQGPAFLGELGLDGVLRPIRGALAVAERCRRERIRELILPRANALEAAMIPGISVHAAGSLKEVVAHLEGEAPLPPVAASPGLSHGGGPPAGGPDLAEVRDQDVPRRALEVAAAGGHNLLMVGPPGSGKSMLARRIPGILPPLELDEALEVTKVHSVAGALAPGTGVLQRRPFRAPHHTTSPAALAGGGNPIRPGEASLAHLGVLFLDELTEFNRNALETLRQPLAEGFVTVSRVRESVRYPARFTLVAAMNPCPCGYFGIERARCVCTGARLRSYWNRFSGPLRDRVDLHVQVPPVRLERLRAEGRAESSREVRGRVVAARRIQARRYEGEGTLRTNAELRGGQLRRWCGLCSSGEELLRSGARRMELSARGVTRVLRLARTISDLDHGGEISPDHLAEALFFRSPRERAPA